MTDCKRKANFLDNTDDDEEDNDEVEVVSPPATHNKPAIKQKQGLIEYTGSFLRKLIPFPLNSSPRKKLHTQIKPASSNSSMSEVKDKYKIFTSKNSEKKEEPRVNKGAPMVMAMARKSQVGQFVTATSPHLRKGPPRLTDPNAGYASCSTSVTPSKPVTNGVNRNCTPTVISKSSPEPVIVDEVKGQSKKELPVVNQIHPSPRPSTSFFTNNRSNFISPRSLSTPGRNTTPNVQRRGSNSIFDRSYSPSSTLKESQHTYSNSNSNSTINSPVSFRNSRISTRSQTKYPPTEVTIPSDDDDDMEAMEVEEPISDQVLHYGSDRCGGNITITRSDLKCLAKGEFLNDVILDFYLTWLLDNRIDSIIAKKVHIFSTFFFTKLTQSPTTNNVTPGKQESIAEKFYSRAKNWLKKVDIFSKDYLIVPVNRKSHWFLLIVCHPSEVPDVEDDELLTLSQSINPPCILIFDSLGISRSGGKYRLTDPLRHLFAAEYKTKFGKEKQFDHTLLPDRNVKTTCQTNYSDCGLFLLQYVEQFLRDPSEVLNVLSTGGSLKNWVDLAVIEAKRSEIRSLILDLSRKSPASEACVAPTISLISPHKKTTPTATATNPTTISGKRGKTQNVETMISTDDSDEDELTGVKDATTREVLHVE